MLTQRQENFTLNLFNGMTQRDAWIKAGYSSKYTMAIVDKNACEMANSSKIQVRLAELRKDATSGVVMTVQKRMERLSSIADEELFGSSGSITRGSNIQAIAELNKMDGSYAPDKLDVSGEILITPNMRALAAKEMLEIREEEDKLLNAVQEQGTRQTMAQDSNEEAKGSSEAK